MADIFNAYTPEQMVQFLIDKSVADGVSLTNFNQGSRLRAIFEAISLLESITGIDYINTLRKAIPISAIAGFGFTQKGASSSAGQVTFYRTPEFTITYSGAELSATLTATSTVFTVTAGADGFAVDLTVATTIQDVVDAINLEANWSAVANNATGDSSVLYNYVGQDILTLLIDGSDGFGVMTTAASGVVIPALTIVGASTVTFETAVSVTLNAGESYVRTGVTCQQTGTSGNISALAIDTENGSGFIGATIEGVDYAKNFAVFTGGEDSESEDDWRNRFFTYIQGLVRGTKFGIQAEIEAIDGVRSATVQPNVPQLGNVTITVDDGTGTLSVTLSDEIDKLIEGDADDLANYQGIGVAGITYSAIAPVFVAVDIDLSCTIIGDTVDSEAIKTSVSTIVTKYVNTRKLGQDVVLAEIVRRVKESDALIYDVTINSPTANFQVSDDRVPKVDVGYGTVIVRTIRLSEEP